MFALFREAYYYLDLLVGYGSPVLVYFLYRTGRFDRFIWHFFWIGAAVGLTWEIPIFVLSGESTPWPVVVWNRPLIAHYTFFMISHTLWDGLLFVIGILLVRGLCQGPHFTRFRWPELLVLVAWGQISELAVEISATANDGWSFVEYWWSPLIFQCNGHNITWLMQAIWAVAAAVYYGLLVRLKPRYR